MDIVTTRSVNNVEDNVEDITVLLASLQGDTVNTGLRTWSIGGWLHL